MSGKVAIGLMALTACAGPSEYVKPCTVEISFTLDEDDAVHKYCAGRVSRLDDGSKPSPSTRFNGCAASATGVIHASENQETWGHEVRHVLDRHCRAEIDGERLDREMQTRDQRP